MQTLICRAEQSCLPLGQRRGISDLANFALDLTWARAETDCALSSTRAYPSPPMSGSPPPLPPKPNPEVGDRALDLSLQRARSDDHIRTIAQRKRWEDRSLIRSQAR
ncbi:hypothetical protein AAE478_001684 [Parahypoxylon ruwenzoriense]